MQLIWHPYKYYPYERDLALREVQALLNPIGVHETNDGIVLDKPQHADAAERLVYFAGASGRDNNIAHTQQNLLERINGNGPNRQSTRYSAHGLHEYKGKFNPQVAKAILNIFGAKPGQRALDPFCGSGTSLVECAHLGIHGVGTDINPGAVFIANAKLKSLAIPANTLLEDAKSALQQAKRSRKNLKSDNERSKYLHSWFLPEILHKIERLRVAIESLENESVQVLLAIASNLLRDYSLQEPQDLRIRRRKSPLPTESFYQAFEEASKLYCERLKDAQTTLGINNALSEAILYDCRNQDSSPLLKPGTFDLALTSPPYATALPYIDTQRLSLVWLNLLPSSEILKLEAQLVGSREMRGQSKRDLLQTMLDNADNLPASEAEFCIRLHDALGKNDGFRRQVVPRLLYRYFVGMAESFSRVHPLLKDGARFGMIVGGNHTVLGGNRFDINTPEHLANIAISRGWEHVETIQLQTYQRYGLHMNNSTTTEALIILQA